MAVRREKPWSIKIAHDIRDWLQSGDSSYASGYDLAHDLEIPKNTWDDIMRGRPVGDIHAYAKIYHQTGIESADPRKIPLRKGTKLQPLTDIQWREWIHQQIKEESTDDEIVIIRELITSLIDSLNQIIEDESSERRDRLAQLASGKMNQLSALLSLLGDKDRVSRERSSAIQRVLSKTIEEEN